MKSAWRSIAVAFALGVVSVLSIACGASETDTAPTAEAPAAESPPIDADAPPSAEPTAADAGPAAGARRNSRFVPLDNPEFVTAEAATFLQPDDRVLGLTVNGESRAYPINMMTFHHVANDVLGGQPVLVTF